MICSAANRLAMAVGQHDLGLRVLGDLKLKADAALCIIPVVADPSAVEVRLIDSDGRNTKLRFFDLCARFGIRYSAVLPSLQSLYHSFCTFSIDCE